jgi:hypothetical protein
MIFTEKTQQEILGTLVLILGISSVLTFFLLESPLDPELFRILATTLMFLIILAGFEAVVLLIHYRNIRSDNKFNPPV